jgi:hypothetical protein
MNPLDQLLDRELLEALAERMKSGASFTEAVEGLTALPDDHAASAEDVTHARPH